MEPVLLATDFAAYWPMIVSAAGVLGLFFAWLGTQLLNWINTLQGIIKQRDETIVVKDDLLERSRDALRELSIIQNVQMQKSEQAMIEFRRALEQNLEATQAVQAVQAEVKKALTARQRIAANQ
jgi:hypothetical protein